MSEYFQTIHREILFLCALLKAINYIVGLHFEVELVILRNMLTDNI